MTRRRSRQHTIARPRAQFSKERIMNHGAIAGAITLLLLSAAFGCETALAAEAGEKENGVYVALTATDGEQDAPASPLVSLPQRLVSVHLEDSDEGYGVAMGYRFNRY